jgi:Ricin-type beta-trefoil lectin domain-like
MGHFQQSGDLVKQEFQAIMGVGTQHIHGTPVYFNSQAAGPIVYVWGENDFLRAYAFDPAKQLLVTAPRAMSSMTAPETNNNGAMPGGFLSITANGGANGIVWASTPFAADASQATVEGVLHAFDAITLQELWNDKLNKARDGIGYFAKFVPPTVANGKLFVPSFGALGSADGSGSLNVYGLLPSSGASLVANGTYAILSRFSQLAIDDPALSGAGGTVMQQWTVNGGLNQSWQLTNVSPNVVSLINKSSGLALEVAGASKSNSALVDQNPYTGGASQLWNVISAGAGFYELTNVNSGQALDVDGGVTTAGAQIDQFPYKSVAWQQWSFN